jgi:N-acetylmuramoyl-L-alanine amidase
MSGKGSLRRRWRASLAVLAATSAAISASAASAAPLSRVAVRPYARGAALAISCSSEVAPDLQSFSLSSPPRLIFDLPGVALAPDQPSSLRVAAAGIRQVRIGQFQAEPPKVRLVLDLETDSAPRWRKAEGDKPGEFLLVFGERGPLALKPPVIEKVGDTALVRISGAGSLPYCAATLDSPPRVYADLTDASLEAASHQPFEAGPIRELRMAQQPDASGHPVARIVVELARPTPYVIYRDGCDLVLAIGAEPWALPLPPYHPAGRLEGKRIVVDPGHGGHDIGAPAIAGPPPEPPFEKDIVLDLGRRLAALLESEGAAVTMTREDDSYLPLQRRAAIANDLHADAFISLHCNSYRSPDLLCGTSVYYDHVNSVELAQLVQQELVSALGTDDKGVRNANFAVIRRTQGPGILVETAYINHQGDRARLTNPNFRERAARAILQGVIRFLSQTPQEPAAGE